MSTDRARTRRALVGATALCLLLVACGEDDGGGGEAAAVTSSTSAASSSPSTADDEGAGVEASGDFCALNEEITRLFGELAQTESEETWRDIEAVVAQMARAAPPELEADVATAVGFYPIARAELEAAGWDVGVLEPLAAEYRSEYGEVEENISAYLDASC